eukprot:scaffold24748_cov35-Prasinocladus_malaysianus.AAC.1
MPAAHAGAGPPRQGCLGDGGHVQGGHAADTQAAPNQPHRGPLATARQSGIYTLPVEEDRVYSTLCRL